MKQVVGNLRQAFCDQSDGLARTEAIASLLFSENYQTGGIAASTSAASSIVNTYSFLETREAFCLVAAVSAYPSPQHDHDYSSRAAGLLPDGTTFNGMLQRYPARLPLDRAHQQAEVSVESVLREMGENGRKRKQRLFRRHQQRQKYQASRSDDASPSADERFNVAGEEEEAEEVLEAKDDEEGDDDQWPSPQHGRTASTSSFEGLGAGFNVSAQRLALAASVSILDGLLLNGRSEFVELVTTVGGRERGLQVALIVFRTRHSQRVLLFVEFISYQYNGSGWEVAGASSSFKQCIGRPIPMEKD